MVSTSPNFGLPSHTLEQLKSCLNAFPEIQWVKIFGSRALGTYRTGSDVDLAVYAESDITIPLASALDELNTPYTFDVIHYNSLSNRVLKDKIDTEGILLTF